MKNEVRVFSPASIGNVSVGFDVLGLAVDNPGDELVARKCTEPGVHIAKITGDNGKLPRDAARNTAGIAANELCKAIEYKGGIEIELHKKMPFGSGLGSSAASAVAGVFAANLLLGEPMSKEELLPFAIEAENTVSGYFADNVAASLFGGMVLIQDYDPLHVVKLNAEIDLYHVVVHPNIEILTADARAVMPKSIEVSNATRQMGNLAAFVHAYVAGDVELMKKSFKDSIAEPHRARLIPGFENARDSALRAGAIGCGISGSGPSVFALCEDQSIAERTGDAIMQAFQSAEFGSTKYIGKPDVVGVREVDSNTR